MTARQTDSACKQWLFTKSQTHSFPHPVSLYFSLPLSSTSCSKPTISSPYCIGRGFPSFCMLMATSIHACSISFFYIKWQEAYDSVSPNKIYFSGLSVNIINFSLHLQVYIIIFKNMSVAFRVENWMLQTAFMRPVAQRMYLFLLCL